MTQFEVTWILQGMADKPKQYQTRADDGFEAEVCFLKWAGRMLKKPVKVLRVERISI